MDNEYKIINQAPAVDDFIRLRAITGLSPRPADKVALGLANSLFAVHIRLEENTIAMARIVGDGALNFDIVDVAVDPAHQGRGLGSLLMKSLMNYLANNAANQSYITLMADVPALYEKFGFEFSSPETEGMYLPEHARKRHV